MGSVSPRFWLGVVLPIVLLALWIALLIATGHGRQGAPLVMFFASFVALPATMLANCWVLFVNWKTRARLFLAGLALPALVGLAAALVVHATGHAQELGMLLLTPFLIFPDAVTQYPRAAFLLWLLAMVALVSAARILSSRSSAGRSS